jgi:outer membrane receptor for ferrienterochelin and colicin
LDNYTIRIQGKNDMASVSFESDLGSKTSMRTVASLYSSGHGATLDGTVSSDARAANGTWYYDTSQVDVAFDRRVDARDLSLRQELATQFTERHLVETGFELHQLQTRLDLWVEGDRSSADTNQSLPSHYALPGKSLPSFLDSNQSYNRVGVWVQDRFQWTSRISPQFGLRIDRSGINGQTSLSPRASIAFNVSEDTRLRAAAGVYVQSPGYEKLFQSDYFVDLSRGGYVGLDNERSFHAVLAAEHDFTPAISARIEAYHKSFSNLIVGRLETEEERLARVARYDFDWLDDEIQGEPQITVFPTNGASGTAYGFDLYLAKKAESRKTKLTGWASYSYGVAERQAYGLTIPFDYDRRHSFSVVGNYRVDSRLEMSATARIASGLPWTPPIGVQVAAEEDLCDRDRDGNRDELVPARDHMGQLLYTFDVGDPSNINSARLPIFARLDARITYRPNGPDGRWSFFLDLLNVLNRDNAGYMKCSFGYNPHGNRPLIYQYRDFSVPLLPSFGVRVRF